MTCIIVDDEPLAREAIQFLVNETSGLELLQIFTNTKVASQFLQNNPVELIFLDIQMPGMNGLDFSRTVPQNTLIIFTTAYAEYALDGFEVEAVDYLVKPIQQERFNKAVNKAMSYSELLKGAQSANLIENISHDYFFVKSQRLFIKINFNDILFIEGLKDYVIMQTVEEKIITAMNIKTIHEQLPQKWFVRVSKSYVINVQHITSFDNNTVNIRKYEIPIGNSYRTYFFESFVLKKILSK